MARRCVRMDQRKNERACRQVLGPWAKKASMSPWVQVTRSRSRWRSQTKSRTALLVCARAVEYRLSVSVPDSAMAASRGPWCQRK